MSDPRIVVWFSCGAASALAAKLTLREYPEAIIARCIVDNEHADNSRFARDCESWFGKEIVELRSQKYRDCWQVWEERRYLNGPAGALCTVEMKKKVRQAFERTDDIQIFGYHKGEEDRAERFIEQNIGVNARFPLIERGVSKATCYQAIKAANIELPLMYRAGFHNANCVGCVKGGAGYWNKIRVFDPETFDRMAKLERDIGASCMNGVYLDELLPNAGTHKDLALPECGLFCPDPLPEEGKAWQEAKGDT